MTKKVQFAKCVQCGYCCTVSACGYGEWDVTKKQCRYLKDGSCSIYEQMITFDQAQTRPMWNSGCCSPLCNTVREAKIRELGLEGNPEFEVEVEDDFPEFNEEFLRRLFNG